MRAVILAAGFGTRLGAVGRARPKSLLPLGARCAADVVAEAAEAVREVGALDVWTHAAARAAFEAWAARRAGRLAVRVLSNAARRPEERLGAVADLAAYLEETGSLEPVLVLAGDNVFDFSLGPLARAARDAPAVVCLDVGSRARVSRLASVRTAADGRIVSFVEKDPAPRSTLAATALYGLPAGADAEVARYLAAGGARDNLGSLMEWWIHERVVRAVEVPRGRRFIDVGHEDDLARARAFEAERTRGSIGPRV